MTDRIIRFFWTAKTENNCAPEWDYLYLLQNGIVPQNLCQRDTFCQFKSSNTSNGTNKN